MKAIPNLVRSHLDGVTHIEIDAFGIFKNEKDNSKKSITPGSVYGFFVSLSKIEADDLFNEAKCKQALALPSRGDFKPIVGDIYPLYWGKDKSLGARINGHITNPDGKEQGKTGTGLIRLCAYHTLHGKDIGVFAIVVNDYTSFEKHIRSIYPDLLKTKSTRL